MAQSEYSGKSQAVHVLTDGPTGPITPVGPVDSGPTYKGQASVDSTAGSPAGLDEDSLFGPIYEYPHIHGRSQAIHVFGADGTPIAVVIPSCECTVGVDGSAITDGITDTFTRYASHSVFDHPGGFNALEYGNFIGTSDAQVPWQVALYNTDEGATVGVNLDGAEWQNSIEVPNNGREAFIYAYLQTPSPVPNQLGTTKKFKFHFVTIPTIDVTLRIIFDPVGVGFGSTVGNTLGAGGNEHVGSAGRGAAFLQVSKFAVLNPSQMGFTLVDWSYLGGGSGSLNVPTTIPTSFWAAGVHYTFSIVTQRDYPTVGIDTTTSTVSDGITSYTNVCAFNAVKAAANDPVYRDPIYQPGIAFKRSTSLAAAEAWVVAVDDVDIPEIRAASIPSHILDDFSRDTSGMGFASSGGEWLFVDASDNFDAVTSGTVLPYGRPTPILPPDILGYYYVEADSDADTAFAAHELLAGVREVWETTQGFVLTGVFSAYNLPGTFLHSIIELSFIGPDGVLVADMRINMDTRQAGESGALEPGSLGVEGRAHVKTDWFTENDGKAYWWKWERVPGPEGLSRLKVWVVGDAEPADWGVMVTTPEFTFPVIPAGSKLRLYVAPGQGPFPYLDFDSVNIYRLAIDGQSCSSCDGYLAYTPDFLPTFRRQIGDPTTGLDAFICTMESAAMVLDWETRGAVSVWGGELVPWTGRTVASIIASGTNLHDAKNAWAHYGKHLAIRSGQTWADLLQCIAEGRAIILQGDYGVFTLRDRCQKDFTGDHAIALMPFIESGRCLTGDPLCGTWHPRDLTALQAYAEALGVAVYGVTSPQKILFAVSSPWVQ